MRIARGTAEAAAAEAVAMVGVASERCGADFADGRCLKLLVSCFINFSRPALLAGSVARGIVGGEARERNY